MFDSALRPLKDRILEPMAGWIQGWVTPNGLSLLAFAAGMLCGVALALDQLAVALILWAANRVLDGLDGTVARQSGRATDAGGYLDIILDFVVYAALPLAMVAARPATTLAVASAILLGVFYVNAATWMHLSAIIERRAGRKGVSQTCVAMPTGLIEGGETILLYTLMIVLPDQRALLFLLMAAMTLLGSAVRFAKGYRWIKAGERTGSLASAADRAQSPAASVRE